MKNRFLLLILIFFNQTSWAQSELQIRIDTDSKVKKSLSQCYFETVAVTTFDSEIENWEVCSFENEGRVLKISSYKNELYHEEMYVEINGDLVYAKETEKYIPHNHFSQMEWNCQFYTKKGKLLSLISLGHGKTEDENWDPIIIFAMYSKRLDEFNKIKK
ncbi:hypothetical protein [Flavobacterium sp. 9AF]|uniref:hypothetical protein n=1 Tax=Flavobacterium sp. 9AF TaxID=2653142 RepID=UPI00135B12CB|nr:hypothetical protein [Flavobacterium sp. 9AF]